MANGIFSQILMNYIYAAIFAALRGAVLSLSVYFYNKYKNKKEKGPVYIFTFIFGLLAVIVYIIKSRKENAQTEENTQSVGKKYYEAISIVLFVLYLVSIIGGSLFIQFQSPVQAEEQSEEAETVYYDKYGNRYTSYYDVVYYTEDNCRFQYDSEYDVFIKCDDNSDYEDEYSFLESYIDCDGNLVFIEEILSVDESKAKEYVLMCLYDKENHYYAMATNVKWDQDGAMLHIWQCADIGQR